MRALAIEDSNQWESVRYREQCLQAKRRLGDGIVPELRARLFTNAYPAETGYAIKSNDCLKLQLSQWHQFERKGLVMPRDGIKY